MARPMSARRSSLTTPVEVIFKNADWDGDGFLNVDEFQEVLKMLHAAIPPEEADQLKAFLMEVGDSRSEIQEIFAEINKSKSGLMSLDEWKSCEFFEEDD